jgi:hypothetical protein
MHWFDDFVKALAGGSVSRRTALGSVGLASGSLAVARALPESALARPRVRATAGAVRLGGSSASATVAPLKLTRGIMRPRLSLPTTFSSGPCAYKRGGALDAMTYTATGVANGETVTLTASRNLHFIPGATRTALSAESTNVIEVTSGGASIVRLETKVSGTRGGTARGTVTLRYGSAVGGARGVDLVVSGRTVTGSILGAERTVRSSHSKIVSSKLVEDAAPVDISIDAELYAAIDQLLQRFKSEASTCNGAPSRRGRASRRASTRGAFLAPAFERRSEFVVADYAPEAPVGEAGLEIQNQYGAPSTPHCTSCMNSAGNQMVNCLEAGGIEAIFGCIPCAAATAIECQAKATAAALACWFPGAGCGEQLCGVGTSCDSGDTCCGGDCCTGSDVCTGAAKTCCPPGYSTACAAAPGSDPFCCGEQNVCCGSNGCCPAGSTCCGGKFCCASGDQCCGDVCCDGAGSVCSDPKNSLCCTSGFTACGTSCCDPKYVCLDSSKGICAPPGYAICGNVACPPQNCLNPGTANALCCAGPVCGDRCCSLIGPSATPSPASGGGLRKQKIRTCLSPKVACRSEFSGAPYTVCCAPNQTCCGDQCCPADAYQCCPDAQGNPKCGICIK